jgi:phosphatidylinositol glycan class O
MKKKNLLLFSWLILLYANGVIYFLQGFLLTRREIHLKSAVFDGVSCCLDSKYKQIIILIIDALRYDFLVYNNSTNASSIPIYHNNLPVVQRLLKDNHGVLYQVCYKVVTRIKIGGK